MQKYRFKHDDSGEELTICSALDEYARLEIGDKIERTSKIDGSPYTMTLIGKPPPPALKQPGATYPMWSDNAGINPEQIPEAMEADRANGFAGIEYHPQTGAVKFPDKATRKRYCESLGIYDRNGSHDDPQRYDSREREIRATHGSMR